MLLGFFPRAVRGLCEAVVKGRTDLLPENLWSATMATDDTQTTMVRHCSGQLRPTGDIHS